MRMDYHLPDPTPLYLPDEGRWSHTPLSPDYHNSEYPAGYFYPTQIIPIFNSIKPYKSI